jgi:hypothetical protein
LKLKNFIYQLLLIFIGSSITFFLNNFVSDILKNVKSNYINQLTYSTNIGPTFPYNDNNGFLGSQVISIDVWNSGNEEISGIKGFFEVTNPSKVISSATTTSKEFKGVEISRVQTEKNDKKYYIKVDKLKKGYHFYVFLLVDSRDEFDIDTKLAPNMLVVEALDPDQILEFKEQKSTTFHDLTIIFIYSAFLGIFYFLNYKYKCYKENRLNRQNSKVETK